MESDWQEYRLADLCDSIDYGFTTSAIEEPVGPKLLRITDIVSGHIDWETVPFCNCDQDTTEKYLLNDNDIVIARTGASTGSSMYVSEPPKAVFASYLVRLKISEKAISRFIAYFLKSPMFWTFMRGILGDKSAQPNASARTMTQVKLRLPSLPDQSAIAHILGSLDDKIELNRRMNETLEAMARAIFKSWFVDFDPVRAKAEGRDPALPAEIAALFPESFENSELGEIPKGWEVKTIGEVVEFAYGKALKASNRKPGCVPVFGSNGPVGFHNEALVKGPGIVIGRKGNPGIVTWSYKDCFPIDTTFYVKQTVIILSLNYLFYALKAQDLPSLSADSAVPGLNRNLAYMSNILVPSKEVLTAFDEQIDPLFHKINANDNESESLASLRDILLPKLISGELRVPDAEKFVEENGV
ncbi:MAG: restriction endonuclease subunit S [bacterium]